MWTRKRVAKFDGSELDEGKVGGSPSIELQLEALVSKPCLFYHSHSGALVWGSSFTSIGLFSRRALRALWSR
jgi:hypothetical protein